MMPRRTRVPWIACAACAVLLPGGFRGAPIPLAAAATAGAPPPPAATPLGVSPLLVDAAAEVWGLIARDDNPVWPGWNAGDTPLLLYLPGEQDLLIHHPKPPEGFTPYRGPLEFPGGTMMVKSGPTLIATDGQNTSMDVGGVRTLVVADPLSNLRQRIGGLLEDPRPGGEKARDLALRDLLPDPYEQMALITHEAFHVYQRRVAPDREVSEMLLLFYPVLSVGNNVGFGLEAGALSDAITAPDPARAREAALRWLAIREHRRAALPPRAIQYEDGTEFNEGLARYTEYRLYEVLEGRTPRAGLARAQGFSGYADLAPRRREMLDRMRKSLRGEVNVNNSPYGTAPLRFRLYDSGLGIGAMLDRVAPDWKRALMSGSRSLTEIARDALKPTDAELANAWTQAQADTARPGLVAAKERLAREGEARTAEALAAFDRGPGTGLVIEYGALESKRVALGFTPFGITRVDSVRTIFEQALISAEFADGSTFEEQVALPVLRDTRRCELRVRLEKPVPAAEIAKLAGGANGTSPAPLVLALPGVKVDLRRATWAWRDGVLRVRLVPAPDAAKPAGD